MSGWRSWASSLWHALGLVYLRKQHKIPHPKAFTVCRAFRKGTVTRKRSTRRVFRWYNLRAILCTKLGRLSAASATFLPSLICAQREEPMTFAWALESLWAGDVYRKYHAVPCYHTDVQSFMQFPSPSFLPPGEREIFQVCSICCCIHLYFHFCLLY